MAKRHQIYWIVPIIVTAQNLSGLNWFYWHRSSRNKLDSTHHSYTSDFFWNLLSRYQKYFPWLNPGFSTEKRTMVVCKNFFTSLTIFYSHKHKSLQDKIWGAAIGDFQKYRHHLMLKKLHMRPYMVMKRRCVWNITLLLILTMYNKFILCSILPLSIMFLFLH